MNHQNCRIFSAFLLVPVAVFFLACCCLQDEAKAAPAEKSKCGACPETKSKTNKSHHQGDCPHATIKAVQDNHSFDLQLTKSFFAPLYVLSKAEFNLFFNAESFYAPQLTAPPIHPSLYFHNPILRV